MSTVIKNSLGSSQLGKLVAVFARHGNTILNGQNKFRGALDIPLDKSGIEDAKDLHEFLKGQPFGSVYRSDTQRTEQTADIALHGSGMTPAVNKDLNSWNLGFLNGELKKPNENFMDFFTKESDTKVPGGESLDAFRHRVQPRIKTAITKGIQSGVPSLVFTHSSVIHEVSHLVHGDHKYQKVKPGGAIGVFHNSETKKLHIRALFKGSKGMEDNKYGS